MAFGPGPGRPPGGPPGGGPPPMKMGAPKSLYRSFRFLRPYWRSVIGAIVGLVGVGATTLGSPQLLQIAIDRGVRLNAPDVILYATGALVLLAALRGVFSFLQSYFSERASQGVAYELRDALFSHIQRLSFSYYDSSQTGQLLTRVTSDVEAVRQFAGQGLIQLLNSVVLFFGTVIILFATNALLAVVALLPVPFILLSVMRFTGRVGPRFGMLMMLLGGLNTQLQENLMGIRVVRAFTREQDETTRYEKQNTALMEGAFSINRALGSNFPTVFFLGSISGLLVVWIGGVQVIWGSLSPGQLIAFNSYLAFLLFPILSLGFLTIGLARAEASAIRIFEVLDAPIDVADKSGATPLPPIQGDVVFENVSFTYLGDDRPALTDINFRAEPGSTIAILGATGSGKSTIVSLIPRFYDVTTGAIRIDGHDVRDVTLASLRSQIGIVLQDAQLVRGTIRENIAFGRPDATDEEIAAAAEAAQAAEFITALPDGYNTVVGDRGVGLSGGQRQRVAIARALLVRPKLLILDDSTSAVDAATEQKIQAALDSLIEDRQTTVFVIAQRMSTVRSADSILLVDGGKLVAHGTHESLLESSQLYIDILGSQLRSTPVVEVAEA